MAGTKGIPGHKEAYYTPSPVVSMTKIALLIVLLLTLVSGCSSIISNSEDFYKDMPRRRINWREYLTD